METKWGITLSSQHYEVHRTTLALCKNRWIALIQAYQGICTMYWKCTATSSWTVNCCKLSVLVYRIDMILWNYTIARIGVLWQLTTYESNNWICYKSLFRPDKYAWRKGTLLADLVITLIDFWGLKCQWLQHSQSQYHYDVSSLQYRSQRHGF